MRIENCMYGRISYVSICLFLKREKGTAEKERE